MYRLLALLTILVSTSFAQANSTICYPNYSLSGEAGFFPLTENGENGIKMDGKSHQLSGKHVSGVMVLNDNGLNSQYNNGKYERNLSLIWSSTAKTVDNLYGVKDVDLDAKMYLIYSDLEGQNRADALVNKAGLGYISVRCETTK